MAYLYNIQIYHLLCFIYIVFRYIHYSQFYTQLYDSLHNDLSHLHIHLQLLILEHSTLSLYHNQDHFPIMIKIMFNIHQINIAIISASETITNLPSQACIAAKHRAKIKANTLERNKAIPFPFVLYG